MHRLIWLNLILLVFVLDLSAQSEKGEIRGYKVYEADVRVAYSAQCNPRSDFNLFVSLGDPAADSISVSGLTIEVPASFCSAEHGGQIDFLAFRDMQVNGLPVEVEEFRKPFRFSKKDVVELPAPTRLVIGSGSIVKTAYRQLVDSKTDWSVTGTVLVFGKFKKAGFSFKRVIPVKIDIKIPNPLQGR